MMPSAAGAARGRVDGTPEELLQLELKCPRGWREEAERQPEQLPDAVAHLPFLLVTGGGVEQEKQLAKEFVPEHLLFFNTIFFAILFFKKIFIIFLIVRFLEFLRIKKSFLFWNQFKINPTVHFTCLSGPAKMRSVNATAGGDNPPAGPVTQPNGPPDSESEARRRM
jgi:hypothetical protein